MTTLTKNIGIDARFMLRPMRGIPLYVTRLCQYLPALGREYQFYFFINKGFEHNDKPENYQPIINEIQNNNPNVTFVNCDDDAEIKWEQIYLPRLIKEHKIDLLHMPANRSCFYPGVPTIVTIHDVMEYRFLLETKYPVSWQANKSIRMLLYNIRFRLYVVFTYKQMVKKASKIITVSKHSSADIVNYLQIPANNTKVIYHGVDPEYLTKEILPLQERTHTLMLGGDSFQKNPEAAIAAWSKIDPDVRNMYPLKIIGFCGSNSSPLKNAIKKYGLLNEVEIRGWVTQEEMVSSFRKAYVFVYPSRYEGFGFPLLQAMASGTPVISTNKSSMPEVLGAVGMQYSPDDHEGMATGILKLFTNDTFWNEQSISGLKRMGTFTWQNSAAEHLDAYREFL